MKKHIKDNQTGFTLIEVIVSLVVAAIMASMIYTYFGNALIQSSVPIFRLQKASNLQKVMENITADYERLNQINLRFKWRAGAKYKVGEFVLPSDNPVTKDSKIANNGRYYECTAATGDRKSGSVLPSWPTVTATTLTLNRTVNDGNLTWTERGYVWKAAQNYPINAIVLPAINNGHFYLGPASPDPLTSGATEPTWTPTATSVSDDSLAWAEAGTILKSSESTIENLYTYLTTSGSLGVGRYDGNQSSYTVITPKLESDGSVTGFIKFSGTSEVAATGSDEKNILKVTIKSNYSAETLTQIFTIR